MRFSSVRLRLTLWNVGVLALILVVLGTALRYTVQANLMNSVDRDLRSRISYTLSRARWEQNEQGQWEWHFRGRGGRGRMPQTENKPSSAAGTPTTSNMPTASSARPPGAAPTRRQDSGPPAWLRPRALSLAGEPLAPKFEEPAWDARTAALSAQGREEFSTVDVDETRMRIFSVPLRRDKQVVGAIQVAFPLSDINRAISSLNRTLLTLAPLALLIAGAGGAFLTDRALRPVRHISQAAEQIEAKDLSGRLAVTGSDEFSELARTFNGMLGRLEEAFTRLEQAFEQQRRFTADASHELRTPLTIIKANTSLALRGTRTVEDYRRALEAADRAADMTASIVQDLLLLTRSDAGQLGLSADVTPIQQVLERASEAVRNPENAPVRIDIFDPGLSVVGNENELIRLFGNLLENAARYTPADGTITVTACAEQRLLVVIVADTGEGIPPEHLPHVTERFYRVDASRTRPSGGTGLGLAICRSIVEAHGGTLNIASVVGRGTTVTVTLPRATVGDTAPACAASAGEAAGGARQPENSLS